MSTPNTVIALDVGGSSVKSACVGPGGRVLGDVRHTPVDSGGTADAILDTFADVIAAHWTQAESVIGLGLAFPGPFDYETGVCQIAGLAKYAALYGLNMTDALRPRLAAVGIPAALPIRYRNDAESAVIGEARSGAGRAYRRVIGITLGTGFGSAFVIDGVRQSVGVGVPTEAGGGWLYPVPFRGQRADDWFSTRGLTGRLSACADQTSIDIAHAADQARRGDGCVRSAFEQFGHDMGEFLTPFARDFGAEAILVMGGIANTLDLFGSTLQSELPIPLMRGELGAAAPLLGVAALFESVHK